MVFEQDSANLVGSNDTLFISYRTIRPFFINNCYDTTNGSILGRRIYKKQDGTFYFFNYNHDTLTIKPQTALNGTWKFCDLTGGSRIEAQVTNILQDTLLGMTDQVKVITFQAKNMNGNNISHFLNQKAIKLSQHYGISRTFDLYFMPDIETIDSSSYLIAGKTVPALGIQNLTWKDVYNFDVGDVFQWEGSWVNGPDWQTMEQVLGKVVLGNNDTVIYTIQYCKIMWLPQPPPNIEITFDTIRQSYYFPQMANDHTIDLLPEAFPGGAFDAPSYSREIAYTGRRTQIYDTYSYMVTDNGYRCWGNPFEADCYIYDYTEGLGVTRTFFLEVDEYITQWSENMVYFRKGTETWGTPLASTCSELLPVKETAKSTIPDITVVPNPVETKAEISLEGIIQNGLHYLLVNSLSQPVLSGEIHSTHFIFARSGLPAGIYIMTVYDDKNTIIARKKIILE
jgi:hypothetical protein